MPEYRLVANGYAVSTLNDADLQSIFRNLKALKTDAFNEFALVMKGHVAEEVLREVKLLTGGSFRDWLHVNFGGGSGHLADLVRDIVHYLNGRIGHAQLLTSISVQENKLKTIYRSRNGVYTPMVRPGGGELLLKEKSDEVYDYDLFRLMAGITPAGVGRIFLLLGGENYYG